MKQLNNKYKILLENITQKVQFELRNKMNDERIIPIENLVTEETDTFGWFIDIFGFKKITGRGKIQIWIDKFPNVERPILSVCFWSSDINRINKVANSSLDNFYDGHPHKVKQFGDGKALEIPLARKYFEKYLVEPYTTKFFTFYFIDELPFDGKISNSFIRKICNQIEWLARATTDALEIKSNINGENSPFENKKIWSEHFRRERSKILSGNVKIRDAYKCRVCDFSFTDKYGKYGNGFAEAHHIISLSKIKGKVKSTENDLITVCSNCHRMLHKMEGKKGDYIKLRKLIQERYSERIIVNLSRT